MDKTYTFYAGVNGAGKSTLYKLNDNIDNAVRVNPDEIVQRIGHWSNIKDQMAAGKEAVKMINDAMKNGLSINQETTLCGNSVQKRFVKIKDMGYKIRLYYIGVSSAEIAKERVKNRVSNGGHDISPQLIEKRYKESLENLKKVMLLCDEIKIYDNTVKYNELLISDDNNLKQKSHAPWLEPYIKDFVIGRIEKELIKAGYLPNERLVKGMDRTKDAFRRLITVKEVKELYKNHVALKAGQKEALEIIVSELKEAELKMKNPAIQPQPEP